jgi:hypothetical protein
MILDLYYRLKLKLHREKVARLSKGVPLLDDMTYAEEGNQWYTPVFAGPKTFKQELISSENIKYLIEHFKKLSPDSYLEFLSRFYQKGIDKFGDNWVYGDINTVLCGICRNVNIKSYMEIGVRRGRSLSVVASLKPEIDLSCFDMWIENYANMENPGPDFVKKELGNIGYKGNIEFKDGNSQQTVPEYFSQNPDKYFDLITVDGDHSPKGATLDLRNVIPHLAIGGFLVFDDICSPYHSYLQGVWEKEVKNSDRFKSFEFSDCGLGVGVGIKQY